MIIHVCLSIGYPGACQEGELEVDDTATEQEIEHEVQEWAYNYIEWGWSKEKPTRRGRWAR